MEKYRATYNVFTSRGILRTTFSVNLESDNYKDAWSEAQDILEYESEYTEIATVGEVYNEHNV